MKVRTDLLLEQFAPTAEEEAIRINDQTGAGLVTDQAFWERMGIRTGEDLAKSVLSQTYSDYYKDLHGIRPRWKDTSKMSVDEIQALIDELDEEAARLSDDDIHLQQTHDQESWYDDMIDAARENPEDIPEEWLEDEYSSVPQQQGMGRRPSGSKAQRRMEVKVTRDQVRQIIKEEVQRAINEYGSDPRHTNGPPPKDSNWSTFADELDIGVLDLDNMAYALGFSDFDDMDISITPRDLAKRDPKKFVEAAQESSIRAGDMSANEILSIAEMPGMI